MTPKQDSLGDGGAASKAKKKAETPMFPAGVKPYRNGAYKTDAEPPGQTWQYWNGKFWGYCGYSAKTAVTMRGFKSAYQNVRWRGLAANPKGANTP
jgi:hypothetical protein